MLARCAIGLLSVAMLIGAQSPPTAATLLDQAKTLAARDHRDIWVIFDASW